MRGGMPNMQGMMKQMQKMQQDMKKEQQAIEETIFEASDPQSLVTIKMNGKRQVVDLDINDMVVDPEDVDMLQDLIIAATNDVLAQIDKTTQDRLGRFTQGLNLPF